MKAGKYTRFEFSGPVVKGYDSFNHVATMGLDVHWRNTTARLATEALTGKQQVRVMDLAAGTGDMALAVQQRSKDATVVAVEPSMDMLLGGMHKLHNQEFYPVQGVTNLPFADETFDAITIAFGVRNFTKLQQDMQECYRLLKPGGRIYVLEFFQPQSKLIAAFLGLYKRTFFPLYGFLITGHVAQYRYLYRSIVKFMPWRNFAEILENVGFRFNKAHPFFAGMVHTVIAEK